ncbi:valine--tRNA ligase [Ancylostoma caninum]|uniref:valine--tRNA ligase n=1 Tax=Ancylostoma caninum TaxID=29170 RepID=A0A368FUM4_ANCCA|nr:valine--tRNA ligase [Ancylostoma caninum]
MVTADQSRRKTEKELKKETEKAGKLAKFEEKQQKLQEKARQAKPKQTKAVKKLLTVVEEPKYLPGQTPGEKKDISQGLPKVYDPSYVESGWYSWWEKQGFFKPEYGRDSNEKPNPKGHFTICIPPPNVTGTLHVGHALATTVEDTLTRWNRMKGKTTLFSPGCDHAGIATQVDKKELCGRTLLPVPGYDDKVEFGVLVSFAYKLKGGESELVVSTTRVETMLGDTAVAVHPEDPRYQHLIGKLPIVPDSFVDREFGTGAVKITPAHDHNDYEVGQRHNLPFITCIDDDGNISPGCGEFSGMRRFDARKALIEALKERGLYRGSEDHAMVVPICSRSKDIIEPLLKAQWYVKCEEMARRAVAAVESGELKLIPDYHVATWNRWLQSNRDWCISRQLWWGHRIPAYFVTVTDGKTPAGDPCDDRYWVSAHSEEIAVQKAAKKFNVDPKFIKLEWDEDVLDTWFSSGMWPFAIMGWPENTSDMQLYFPSNVLETGHDILFFWVARMVFMSQELTGKLPFKEVYLHAMIRDAHGRKMSKSLGNVIDPLDVIRGVTLAELNRQLTSGNLDAKELAIAQAGQARDYPKISGKESIMDKWILSRIAYAVERCNYGMDTYNFTQFTTTLYEFWLYDLCDIYLEAVKPVIAFGSDEARKVAKATLYHCVETGLRLISPVMPFLSEELWQHLPRLATHPPSIVVHAYPETSQAVYPFSNEKIETDVSFAMSVVRRIRSLRSDYGLTNKTKTDLYISVNIEEDHGCLTSLIPLIKALSSSNKIELVLTSSKLVGGKLFQGIINVERELVRLAGKKEKNEVLVAKLLEQQSRPDYEEKVPLPIRIANAEKKDALLAETRSIEAAMTALNN